MQRFFTYVWVAAAAGAAVTLALAVLVPRRGVGVGALAGPLASLVAVVGLLAMTVVLGGGLDADFVTSSARLPVALGLILAVLAAPAGLLAWHQRRPLVWVWPTAAALALVAVLAVVAGRDALTGNQPIPVPDAGGQELALVEVTQYAATATGSSSATRRSRPRWPRSSPTRAPTGRATRIRAEVLAPLRALLGDAEAYQPPTPNIRSVHLTAVASLRAELEAFEALAAAYETDGDPSTAWRVEGSGRGEGVALRLPAPARITQVGLVPGYAKTDPTSGKDRFGENRRIREVRWYFSGGTIIRQRFQDQPTMQRIAVDVTASWVVVEVVATLPGDPDHDYAPISDVSVVGTS